MEYYQDLSRQFRKIFLSHFIRRLQENPLYTVDNGLQRLNLIFQRNVYQNVNDHEAAARMQNNLDSLIRKQDGVTDDEQAIPQPEPERTEKE